MRYIAFITVGAAVYLILLVLTNVLMHRQVTTELMLIVFWACMEICACNALYAESTFSMTAFIAITVITLISVVSGLICYLKDYDLEPMTAFYDGMVSLILFALVMIGISIYQGCSMR